MKLDLSQANRWMKVALTLAEAAGRQGEVPIGAVVVSGDRIVGQGGNRVEQDQQAQRHAELLAIEEASKTLGTFRLTECVLVVTVEPCPMCAGAVLLSRIPTLLYGAADPRFGAFGSHYDLSIENPFGPTPRIIAGVCEKECSALLHTFFERLRRTDR